MKFKRVPLIAYLCVLPILLSLGVWQLKRAEEKRLTIELKEHQQTTDTFVLSAKTWHYFSDALLYKPVKVVGHYDGKHQYLLDNQINKGRVGYFVLTPFMLENENKAVLVNRGWLPLGRQRSELPDITVDNSEVTITGRINRFPRVGIKLVGADIPSASWPALVQVVDTNTLAKQLGYPLLGLQIELDKTVANGYTREWQTTSVMTPEQHLGYAVQWFLLAITLTILFIRYGIKTNHD